MTEKQHLFIYPFIFSTDLDYIVLEFAFLTLVLSTCFENISLNILIKADFKGYSSPQVVKLLFIEKISLLDLKIIYTS